MNRTIRPISVVLLLDGGNVAEGARASHPIQDSANDAERFGPQLHEESDELELVDDRR